MPVVLKSSTVKAVSGRLFEMTRYIVEPLKHIHVTCAIIEKNGFVLAAQRSAAMSLPLKWEFPGGKIDTGESPEGCLKRELMEELGITVKVGQALSPNTYHYPAFTVTLYPFICGIDVGEVILHEHSAIMWLPPEKLLSLDWADADIPVIESYLIEMEKHLT